MAARLALIAGILLLALAGTASAHGLDPSHTDTRRELREVDIAATVNAVVDEGGLPAVWCGTERTSDDTAHKVFDNALPQFKLVYAYPNDRANRFAQWKDALQADVSLIGRFMGAQSGGTKAPRFDMGTDCGTQYVDIQVVQLPGPRSAYVDDFDGIRAAVRSQLGTTANRNVVVLADRLSSQPAGYWYGLGSYRADNSAGAGNANNLGGFSATLFVPDGEPAPGADPDGWWPEGMLHEMTHNLGGVQANSPHATSNGHCYDGYDVMCYDDGGLPQPLTYDCPRILGVMSQRYDCGSDDYFNVAPAAGSYLATHWNTYDNVFLGTCAGVAPACGGSTTVTPVKPVATAGPEVFGTPRVGATLTALRGTWQNAPVAYAYQWEHGDGVTWAGIAGATGPTYVASSGDVGRRLRVRVVATNGDGSTAAYSNATEPVVAAGTTPQNPGTTPGGGTVVVTPGGTTTGTTTNATPRQPKGSATLKVAIGRGKGKRLGTIGFSVAGGRLTSSRTKLRLPRGRYELALCTTAGASATIPRCVKRRVSVKRGAFKLPALSVRMADGVEGRVSYTVTAVGRMFAARTAKRPRQGVILRG